MPENAFFNRICKILVGKGGREGTLIEGLRISFSISKTGSKNPNQSEVKVWNLKPETRRLMERPDTRLILYAGYSEQGDAIKIYEGEVVYCWAKQDGADWVTQFDLGEGVKATRDSMVSLSYQGTATSLDMMRDIANRMNLGLDLGGNVPSRTWANGISFHGTARQAMDRVTRPDGLSWSIQGGVVQVVRTGGPTLRRAIVLSADSGMIGSPERKRHGPREAVQVTDRATNRPAKVQAASSSYDGWEVKSLLLPSLVPNDRVKLESRTVQGTFVIREIKHTGDTHQGDWQSEITLVDDVTAARLTSRDNARRTGSRGTGGRGAGVPNVVAPPFPPALP